MSPRGCALSLLGTVVAWSLMGCASAGTPAPATAENRGSGDAAPARPPAGARPGDAAGINGALNAFHDAAADADMERYFGQMTPDVVFLGTDATERWVGDEFRSFCRRYFDEGKGWTYHPRDRRITMGPVPGIAWFDELLDNEKLGECRGSGVVVKRGDRWLIAQYNLSIPVPNALADEVVRRIGESR